MKVMSLLCIALTGCLQPSESSVSSPIGFYQGYAVTSRWNASSHQFLRAGTDSVGAQIRVISDSIELKATVSINGQAHPFDVFLFAGGGYYTGNDKTSYAYFSEDYHAITWGRRSDIDTNLYETIYARK